MVALVARSARAVVAVLCAFMSSTQAIGRLEFVRGLVDIHAGLPAASYTYVRIHACKKRVAAAAAVARGSAYEAAAAAAAAARGSGSGSGGGPSTVVRLRTYVGIVVVRTYDACGARQIVLTCAQHVDMSTLIRAYVRAYAVSRSRQCATHVPCFPEASRHHVFLRLRAIMFSSGFAPSCFLEASRRASCLMPRATPHASCPAFSLPSGVRYVSLAARCVDSSCPRGTCGLVVSSRVESHRGGVMAVSR